MISKERRKALESAGKIKPGNVTVLKKRVPSKPSEATVIANKIDATMERIYSQQSKILEKIIDNIDKLKNLPAVKNDSRDPELSGIIKTLPGLLNQMLDVVKMVRSIEKTPVTVVNKIDRPVEWKVRVTERDQNKDIKTVKFKAKTAED